MKNNGLIRHVNYASDFRVIFAFPNKTLPSYPWRIELRTPDTAAFNTYVASFDGKFYRNCIPLEDNTILVLVDRHNLSAGPLCYDIKADVPDSLFPDGEMNITLPGCMSVVLWDGITEELPVEQVNTIIATLKGDSAYDIFKRFHPESTLTESEYADGPVLAADAANTAGGEANRAAEKALTAAEKADTSTGKATEAAERAEDAAKKADRSAEAADLATAGAMEAAESADAAAASANGAAESAQKAADKANISAAGADASAKKADTATAEASSAAGAARNAAASANAASGKAESAASSANAAAVSANGAASAATTAAGRADKSSATADTAAAGATAAASKADIAAAKADAAAEDIMQLPIVRTDMPQEIAAKGQALARENISAVGALPVALTLAGDNTLSVSTPLSDLTAHYKLYAVRPGTYRWAVVISDASGGQVEETEAEAIPADGVLHLLFRSQVLGQTYDLALTLAADAVSGVSVAPWRRTEQAGANTTSGGYLVTASDLNKYSGDRGLEVFFRTGSDVSTRQQINANNPIDLLINQGAMYVNLWGLWANSFRVDPDTDYHVVVSFEKDKLEASLYVNGRFISSRVRKDAPPVYSALIILGRINIASHPFKGTIYHARLFNFAPTAEDVAVFYNNGDPTGYIVPAEMRGSGNSYQSDFSTGVDGWRASDANMTIAGGSGALALSSTSDRVRTFRTFPIKEAACRMPHAYAFEVVVDGDSEFSRMQFYPFSSVNNTNVLKSDGEIIDEGLRLRGVVSRRNGASFGQECYCYFYDVPVGTVVKIKSIEVTPLDCIAEYLPQNATPGMWYDSSPQFPINGNLPSLWKSAGGYDLVATGTPEVVYKSARRENTDALAEVLAQSECSLEARIARLEKALIALVTGQTFIPKLAVKELAVWGDNNLIVTGDGAPAKAPDRAGQIYIDTKNNAQYRSTGNAAVSDWKNA